MEEQDNKVESAIRNEDTMHKTKVTKMENDKATAHNEINKRYEDLQVQEANQKDENT